MLIRKETGGATITHGGKSYTWKTDGAAIQVPYDLAVELLAIKDADFSVPETQPAEAKAEPEAKPEVTEPAPAAKAEVREPAPKAAKAAVRE